MSNGNRVSGNESKLTNTGLALDFEGKIGEFRSILTILVNLGYIFEKVLFLAAPLRVL